MPDPSTKYKHLLIDTDTGVDDALALVYALRSPRVRIEAITTVAGNVEVEKCTRNVNVILDAVGVSDRPRVVQGAKKPLRLDLVTAPEVHGDDGLGNTQPPVKGSTESGSRLAVECIRSCCDQFQGQLTIVALGPLTNIALAWKKYPDSLKSIHRIVSMGGAFMVPGNTGPVAEFNYFVDPHAANLVLNSGLPVTVVPLDLTEQIVMRREELKGLALRHRSRLSRFIVRFTRQYMAYHQQTLGFEGGFLHDPMAMAIAIHPSFADYTRARIIVESEGRITRGMTDSQGGKLAEGSRTKIAVSVDRAKFMKSFRSRVMTD